MTAFLAIILTGPATVVMVAATAVRSWTPDRVSIAATAAFGGLTTALVLDEHLSVTALPLVALGPAAAVVDVHEHRLPNVLTGTMLAATVSMAIVSGPVGWSGIAVAAVATLGLLVVKAAVPGAVGWGDVKMAPTVAIVLGQHAVMLPGLLCIVGLIAVTAAAVATQGRAVSVPYGPALLLGTLAALV